MRTRLLKAVVWVICATPAALLLYRTFVSGDLGVNPVETLQHETGRPALQILLATLAVTPLRRLSGWSEIIKVRRLLGLWAFFYGVAHFAIYLVFDRLGNLAGVAEDVLLRRFVLAGMVALLAMLPLAITSTSGWIRRLGGKRWRQLHRLAYVAAAAGALHFIWKEKVLTAETLTYFAVVVGLLGYRLVALAGWPAPRGRMSFTIALGLCVTAAGAMASQSGTGTPLSPEKAASLITTYFGTWIPASRSAAIVGASSVRYVSASDFDAALRRNGLDAAGENLLVVCAAQGPARGRR